jgi:hypothetical protein
MKSCDVRKGARLGLVLTILCAAAFGIITFIIKPVTVWSMSFSPYNLTPLPYFMNIVYQLAENVAFALCFAVIIYGAVAREAKKAWLLFLIYAAASVLRHAADLAITYFSFSFVDATDVFNAGANLLFELICTLTVLIISICIGSRYNQRKAEIQKAARNTGDLTKVQTLNISSLYSRQNPLQRCALIAGILLSALKIAMRVSHDIKYISFYGVPADASEILLMVAYYLSDLLVCIVVYAICHIIFKYLIKKDARYLTA